MSDERPPDARCPTPAPLDYRPPRDDVPKMQSPLATLAVLAGVLLAVCGVLWAGANWYLSLYGLNPGNKTVQAQPPVVFAALAVAAIVGLVTMHLAGHERLSRPARFFVIGLLTGLGLTSLLEGVCFLNP